MPIRKLLMANRGEVARRVFRTCRELGIRTVAVYSPPDAGAPFVAEADEAVPLRGARAAESYLDIAQILAAAEATGADAVHPGWGFLAENASFAEACAAAGLVFVGPPPDAIAAMGSKIEARRLMEAAGVPVVPGATVNGLDDEELQSAAKAVGYPILVKASAGGGGKGMRLVAGPEDLVEAVADAGRQAVAAFGDAAVFLERYVSPVRHVEIQVAGDHHGAVVSLFERDCSVQRRHQKLVEEAPSPAVDAHLRARMGEAAVTAATAVGYHGVGTVEFLLGPDGEFYFLEMNTRLQVEHPVTEAVTGLDLVRIQLAVAEDRPLPSGAFNAAITGHAIEVRLYAEDPLDDYRPHTGRIEEFAIPAAPGVRVDSGVETGSEVGTDYDSMLAKILAWGATRNDAVRLLIDTLQRARIHGIGTNRDLLVAILAHDEFTAGGADTGFLDRHLPIELVAPTTGNEVVGVHGLAAALAAQTEARSGAAVLGSVRSGFRNNPGPPSVRRYLVGDETLEVGYRLGRAPSFSVNGRDLDVALVAARPDEVELLVGGVRCRFSVRRYGPGGSGGVPRDDSVNVDSPLGSTALRAVSRFPDAVVERPTGSLLAPMPGAVVKVLVTAGDVVAKGDPIVVIEAMKMEHRISADRDGVVRHVLVAVGRQVGIDEVLAVIDDGLEPEAA